MQHGIQMTVVLVSTSLLLSGCWGKQALRQPVTVDEMASDVEQIREDQSAMQTSIASMEERIEEQAEVIHKLQVENQYLYQELDAKLSSIDEKLQDAIGRTTGFSDSGAYWAGSAPQQDGYAGGSGSSDWDAAAAGAAAGAYASQQENIFAGDGGDPDVERASTGGDPPDSEHFDEETPGDTDRELIAAAGGTAVDATVGGQSKRLYDQAYLDLSRGNYSLAILGFTEFLRREPDTELSDNAQYWIGECYYAQSDFGQAVREFNKVLNDYGSGDKAAAAMLKLGFSEIELGDPDSARSYLAMVTQRYPDTEESKLARDKLRSIE